MGMNRVGRLSRFHVIVGMTSAVPLIVIAVSGVLLGFYDGLRHGSAPYRLEKPVTHPLGPAALVGAARSAYPGGRMEMLYLPATPERAVRVRMTGEAGRRSVIFLHPGTGKPIAVRDAAERDWVELLHEVHRGKIAGFTGEILVAAAALSVVLLWLSGLPSRRRGGKVRHLHGRLGRVTGGLLALIALTGGMLAFAKPLREHLYPPPRTSAARALPAADIATLLRAGSGAYAVAPLDRIIFPVRGDQPLVLRFRDGGRVWLDGGKGEVLRTETPYAPWVNLLYPLHSGRILGRLGPPLVAALGVLLLLLIGSGYLMRRKGAKSRISRSSKDDRGRGASES